MNMCVDSAPRLGAATGCVYEAAETYKTLMTPAQRKIYETKAKACEAKFGSGDLVTEVDLDRTADCMPKAAKALVKK